MSSTLYSSGTVVTSNWLNDADTATYNYLTAVAGTNTITATGPVSMTSYTAGDRFYLKPVITNTGAVTVNISGLGVQPITKNGSTNLIAGDLVVGNMYEIVYDGTLFQVLNPSTQSVAATDITGQVAVANGGTGASTAALARTNLDVAQIGPLFSVYRNTQQVLTSGAATEIIFNTATYDTNTAVNLTNGRFTPQVAGYYNISSLVWVTAAGGLIQNAQIVLHKNGTPFKRGDLLVLGAAAEVTDTALSASTNVFLNGTTDYVSIFFTVTLSAGVVAVNGGSSTDSWFSGNFIRP